MVAVATAPGVGALGVVRVSGPDAIAVAGALVDDRAALERQPSHTLRRVSLHDPQCGAPIDDAVISIMRAPRSYTGEDVVELSCHGSPAVLAVVTERLRGAGARLAEPGEFTRRAFLNGRLDLARAEAVALLIGARSERAVMLAARALSGGFSDALAAMRDELLDVIAGLEVSLDFPDDGVGLTVAAAAARIGMLAERLAATLAAARRGRLVHDGVTIAIVGPPNAGKSSLLNALLGRDRSIVAPTPGTTRDVVEGAMIVAGVPTRLLDTAGLGVPADAVEAEGMRRSRSAIEDSDLVLLVQDGSVEPDAGWNAGVDLGRHRAVAIRSKSDLPCHPRSHASPGAIDVSSLTGAGIAALHARLTEEVTSIVGAHGDEGQIASSLRQVEALEAIHRAVDGARQAIDRMPLEAVLLDLREALSGLSGLLGLDVGDAILDRVFAAFCVGK